MRYKGLQLPLGGKLYTQISRNTARKRFNNGDEILLHPSNMRFDNMWQRPMPIDINSSFCINEEDREKRFDQVCADYMYYNGDNERGKYINYFVEITKKEARKM